MLFAKKKYLGAAFAAAMIAVSFNPTEAEARITLTPVQEQQIGWGQINSSGAVYQTASPQLAEIQNTLIKWNKDKLKAYSNDNVRGLRSPHLLITNRSKVSAYSLPGGHTFISDAMVVAFLSREFDPNTGVPTGQQKENQFGNGYEIYGHSAIAAAIAHENAHWERNFIQKETDTIVSRISSSQEDNLKLKLQVGDGRGYNNELDRLGFTDKLFPSVKDFVYKEELEADKGAMEFLDNVDVYSPGSIMTVVSRLRDGKDKPKTLVHPVSSVRKKQVIEHIKKLSGGRVQIDEQGKMKLDGKLFMGSGYMPERSDVTAFDRTVYVAGQLAKCVHDRAKRVSPMDDAHSISSAKGMIPIVMVNNSTRKRYVIDKFDISEYDAKALEMNKNEGHSAENKAARELVRFLQK